MEKVERIKPWGDSSYLVRFINYDKDALISRKNAHLVKGL
jgi:DNA-binding LytR/AlgR family response regulator